MTRKGIIPAVAVLALAALAAGRSVVFVDETETVIVTQFGDPIDLLDEAGPYLKAPYQSTIRIDRRLQIYDPRPSEFLAKEKKNVNLDVFVCWRVSSPRRFLESVTDPAGAEMRIHDLVFARLAAEVGSNPLEALVCEDPNLHRLDGLVAGVAGQCDRAAQDAYGIEIVDVRLKRISLPAEVRDSVFRRMRTERERIAGQYRAEGLEEAMKIRTAADNARKVTLAKADAEAQRIRGKAEAQATAIYTKAHQEDPEFYELLRSLEAYKKILGEKTTILLSADSDLLKYLTRGSMLEEQPGKQ